VGPDIGSGRALEVAAIRREVLVRADDEAVVAGPFRLVGIAFRWLEPGQGIDVGIVRIVDENRIGRIVDVQDDPAGIPVGQKGKPVPICFTTISWKSVGRVLRLPSEINFGNIRADFADSAKVWCSFRGRGFLA